VLARDVASCAVVLDADSEGRRAEEAIKASGLTAAADVFHVPPRAGCEETEFEDLIPPSLYIEAVCSQCGACFDEPDFLQAQRRTGGRRSRAGKWSDVMEKLFQASGKTWRDHQEAAKQILAEAVQKDSAALPAETITWAKAVADRVLRMLSEQ
jgi:hypothetical protein